MFEINPFSSKTYVTNETVKISNDGTTFVKSGADWIGSNGGLIQQTNNGLVNLRTGVNSNFGDPFGDDDE